VLDHVPEHPAAIALSTGLTEEACTRTTIPPTLVGPFGLLASPFEAAMTEYVGLAWADAVDRIVPHR
jgi:hypothetical protein